MGIFFPDPLFERFAVRALSHALYGGADFGECFVTASQIAKGDPDSWFHAWTATADRVFAIADACAAAGRSVSAREAYLRASNYYRTSYLPLFGAPVEARLVEAFDREAEAFARAAERMVPAVEAVEIPYEGTSLPGYFHRADDSGLPRPTLIATNGYDATVHEAHFAHAVAAVRRGYHCLTFDGPGQGRPLIHQGLVFRPDWEAVVGPVVDYALSRPDVDPQRIALTGWSFGGYLAPRAASGEHRLAACIADPGQWDLLEALRMTMPLPPAVRERLPEIAPADLEALEAQIRSNPYLHWTFRRALWVHGLESLADYFRIAGAYSLKGRAERIRCPTFVAWAEADPIARFADQLYAALQCPRTLVRFTTAEGAGGHCEETGRSLFHQRAYDWLDAVFTSPRTPDPG
ncbi:alpha/beta fold hydrolase [Synechococcus sp. CS-1328]|nr:alpha/beta fold hydrolase [Synechococcus sp. CS-1328]